MQKEYQVSFVVPCFNGFKYINKCLQALENQTYKNFEVIIVDDFSTDNSYKNLVDLLKKTSLDMTVIQNEKNMGPGYSRKKGVTMAKGKYICFCDSDDWIENSFLEDMLTEVKQSNSDCVFCDCNYVFNNEKDKHQTYWYKEIKNCNSKNELLAFSQASLCLLMVERKVLLNIDFPELYHGEDAAVVPNIIKECSKVSVCKKALYNYQMRSDSSSNNFDRKAFESSLTVFMHIRQCICEEYPVECEFIGIKEILYVGCLNAVKCKINKAEIISSIKYFTKLYPNYMKNLYFKKISFSKKFFIYLMRYHLFLLAKCFAYLHTKYINK